MIQSQLNISARSLGMGGSQGKINLNKVKVEEIKGSSPIETTRFCPPFRKFLGQEVRINGREMETSVHVQEPTHESLRITQDIYMDLEDAFETRTKDIELDAVLFDDQYIDRKTYIGKCNSKDTTLQLRPFSNFNTHAFNQILYEISINKDIQSLGCKNLLQLKDHYIIQTGLEVTGEQFPNTQVLEMESVATNLSEIIRYRRENNWAWTTKQINALAADLTNAISVMHHAKMSHNDIRPCNVFYSTEKNCYQLGCFANTVKQSGTATNQVRTSNYFGAPELLVQAEADLQKADIYSLGMTLLCAFFLCEPVDRKKATHHTREYSESYTIMTLIKEMIMPVEKRITLETIRKKMPKGENSKKMKSLIQSLRYKNAPKDRKLVNTKKAMSDAYEKLGLWNEWKDNVNEAYELEQNDFDEYKKANSLFHLAKIDHCRGDDQSAEEYAKTASKIYRGLGYTAYDQGNNNEALNFFEKAIACTKYYEMDHDLDTAKNMQGLALAHAEKGDYAVSKPLINQAGYIVSKSQGRDSIEYCRIKMSEAKIESDFGQFQSSDRILHQCLAIAEQKIKFNQELGLKLKAQLLHELGRNTMMESAYSERKQDTINRAESLVNEATAINQQFDDNHIALAANVETCGEIDLRRQDYANAKANFRKAQLLRDTYLSERNLDNTMEKEKADTLCNIAACENGLGDHSQALKNYNQALKIYKAMYGSDHNKYSAIAIGNMSKVYHKLEEFGKTRECLRLATEILQDLLGKEDPDYEHFQHLYDTLRNQ